MKWRLRFLWMRARPLTIFLALVAVPFLPVVPWVMAAGPDPAPMPAPGAILETLSLADPIPKGAVDGAPSHGPSPPLDPAAVRKAARGWEVRSIDGGAWKLLMTRRFAVRGDIRTDDLRAVGAFAERFLDAVHERLKGDLTDLRLSIRVFSDEEEFRHWASCRKLEAAEWIYDDRGGEVALLFGPGTDVSFFCGRLMRGIALEYFDRVLDYEGPPWVAEGVAEWFADYEVSKEVVTPRRRRGDVSALLPIADPVRLDAAWKAWAGEAR